MAVEMKGSSILDHVPIEDAVHKENTIKPGPWGNAHKKGLLIAPTIKASFKGNKNGTRSELLESERRKCFPIRFFSSRRPG